LNGTRQMEAAEDIFAQMSGEGPTTIMGLAMDRTGTAPLLGRAFELVESVEIAQHLFEGDLLAQIGVVDGWALTCWAYLWKK
jgi:hypothetical protein